MLWIVLAVVVVVVVGVVLAVDEAEVRMWWRRVGLYHVGVAHNHKVAPPLDTGMITLKHGLRVLPLVPARPH